MSIQDWAGLTLTILSILGIVITSVRWYIDFKVQPIIDAVEDIRSETKTNGGSSMRDEIKDIKLEQVHAREKRKAQSEKIDHMYDLLLEYVSRNK